MEISLTTAIAITPPSGEAGQGGRLLSEAERPVVRAPYPQAWQERYVILTLNWFFELLGGRSIDCASGFFFYIDVRTGVIVESGSKI